jgi:hypothetical protein
MPPITTILQSYALTINGIVPYVRFESIEEFFETLEYEDWFQPQGNEVLVLMVYIFDALGNVLISEVSKIITSGDR